MLHLPGQEKEFTSMSQRRGTVKKHRRPDLFRNCWRAVKEDRKTEWIKENNKENILKRVKTGLLYRKRVLSKKGVKDGKIEDFSGG